MAGHNYVEYVVWMGFKFHLFCLLVGMACPVVMNKGLWMTHLFSLTGNWL